MEVFVANEQEVPVDEARLSALARHSLTAEGVDDNAELSVLLVTSDHMRQLNERFAGDDYATDVLAFPMMEEEEDSVLLGDVVMCPQVAGHNAASMGHSLGRELDVILVHGTLHLLGYDHQGEQDGSAMDGRLRELLDSFRPTHV
ncbi:rRNA maturation RNase YbeY [soil metagenome]